MDNSESYISRVSSFSELDNLIGSLVSKGKKFILRGQTEDWPLLPSIARDGLTPDIEIKIFEEFKEEMKKSSLDVSREEISSLDNDFEWLVLGRHYHLIARCLDWTYFHDVALYFAANNAIDKDGVVWIYELAPYKPEEWLPLAHKDILTKRPFDLETMKIYHPKSFLDLRTDKQGAVVTIFPHPWKTMEEMLGLGWLRKITIPASLKQGVLNELDCMGVNSEALFQKENKAKKIEDICMAINCKYGNLACTNT
jgi:hypothetical protein